MTLQPGVGAGIAIPYVPPGPYVGGTYATAATLVFTTQVTGDTQYRYGLEADGTMLWGSGSAVQDVNLYRSAVATLKTDGTLTAAVRLRAQLSVLAADGTAALVAIGAEGPAGTSGITFGSGQDTNVYRSAGNTLKTDDALIVALTTELDGVLYFGTAHDTQLSRTAADTLTTPDTFVAGNLNTGGNVTMTAAGGGIKIKQGANARLGRDTLVAGTVTIANTTVAAADEILYARRAAGGTIGELAVANIVDGVSFDIVSASNLDTSTVSWQLVGAA